MPDEEIFAKVRDKCPWIRLRGTHGSADWHCSISDYLCTFNNCGIIYWKKVEGDQMNRIQLPNGCGLYWKDNGVGGRIYFSDENGIETVVWDTALVSESTLIATITQENTLSYEERAKERKSK